MGKKMVQKLGSSTEGSKDPMAQIITPKFMEEVATKVMKADKATKLFQTMAIVSLNMKNLTLEVSTLKNKLVMGEKEKACYMRNWIRRDFQKGYKHMWKSRGRIG